jgi:DNA-binding PadR family transcriptional regulator
MVTNANRRSMPVLALAARAVRHGHRGLGHGLGHGLGRGFGHGWGHGGWGHPGFPPWLRGFSSFGGPGSRRRGRGDVRLALLGILAEEPMHGYQLIREIAQRSEGRWRASPGSVYPTLSQLEDEGLVGAEQSAGRRVFHLTDEGRAEVSERAAEFTALWTPDDEASWQQQGDLAGLVMQVGAATMQVASAGTDDQRERAAELLEQTRRSLYRLLADETDD